MGLALRVFRDDGGPEDIGARELFDIWLLMRAEDLVDVVFHDSSIRRFEDFLDYARKGWFIAVMDGPAYLGWGMVNNFSNSGNTGFAHFCSFEYGRASGLFYDACMLFHDRVAADGVIDQLIAILPQPYRGARAFVRRQGFKEAMRLPGAMLLRRKDKERRAAACVYVKTYQRGE